jgi:hypothetical protein
MKSSPKRPHASSAQLEPKAAAVSAAAAHSLTAAADGITQHVSLERLNPHLAKVTFSNPPANLLVPETVSRRHDIVVEWSEDHHVPGCKSCGVLSTQESVPGARKDLRERRRFGDTGPGLDQVFCCVGRIEKCFDESEEIA